MNKQYIQSIKKGGYCIKVDNLEEKSAVKEILNQAGENTVGLMTNVQSYYIIPTGYEWGGFLYSTNKEILFNEFVKKVFSTLKKTFEIQINDKYSAVFTAGETDIVVGCQRIPVTKIEELLKGIKNL